ncbi:MAG: hypothetical protein ACTFAK_01250 [Candidatus Electronema sp. VV]
MKKIEQGLISGCQKMSTTCQYRCCDQSKVTSDDFCQENSILMYPGEWEKQDSKKRDHILVSDDNFYGGKLGYCDKEHFDQSKCDPLKNFKSLDCRSYPFFPVFEEEILKLAIDERCPLPRDTEELRQHYRFILNEWRKITEESEEIRRLINKISIDGYKIINF